MSARCATDIFRDGEPVALLDARSEAAENWVQHLAQMAAARVDWHCSGGIAQVLHLGDTESRARVEAELDRLQALTPAVGVRVLRRFTVGETSGLYRAGVTVVPSGAIASWMNPITGQVEYAVDPGGQP